MSYGYSALAMHEKVRVWVLMAAQDGCVGHGGGFACLMSPGPSCLSREEAQTEEGSTRASCTDALELLPWPERSLPAAVSSEKSGKDLGSSSL